MKNEVSLKYYCKTKSSVQSACFETLCNCDSLTASAEFHHVCTPAQPQAYSSSRGRHGSAWLKMPLKHTRGSLTSLTSGVCALKLVLRQKLGQWWQIQDRVVLLALSHQEEAERKTWLFLDTDSVMSFLCFLWGNDV